MEGFQNWVAKISKDPKLSSSSFDGPRGSEGLSAALSSSDQFRVVAARPPRQVVSLWTCSKIGAICFVAGMVVGYTLKRRVRNWASRLLKRLRDD